MFDHVLSPGKIGNLELKNRFVMPGMGANMFGEIDDVDIAWYEERAKGGFGLIITEFQAVDPLGKGTMGEVVSTDELIPVYKQLSDAVHKHGAKTFVQLHHAGRQVMPGCRPGEIVGASAIPCPREHLLTRELTTEEVWDLVEKFGDAALRCKKGGFDGVEVHGGHGYGVAAFMSLYANRRTDEFGGDLAGRLRFPTEIVKNIKKKCGDDFPVSFRLSYDEMIEGGRKLNESIIICKELEKAGVDAFNVSLGVYGAWHTLIAPYFQPVAFNIDPAKAIKNAVNVPVMAVGRLNDPIAIESVLEDGYCDFVLMGRESIADPYFPTKVAEGRTDEICPCVGCMTRCQGMPATMGMPEISCAMNPFAHHELDMVIKPADQPKNVVVVGGGPGGLEAAWVAAACGHKVTLLEKSGKLGGQMLYAMMPPSKGELARAIKYYVTMCRKYGVDIRLNTEADKDSIVALKPDAVILATGATPIVPSIPNEGAELVLAQDILKGKVVAGEKCLVIGGGLVGLETAEFIVGQLRHVDVVEMSSMFAVDQNESVWHYMEKYLRENNTALMASTKVTKLLPDGAVCETPDGEVTLSGYDMIVLALGSKAYNPLEAELEGLVDSISVVGDAVGDPDIANIRSAVEAGAMAALEL